MMPEKERPVRRNDIGGNDIWDRHKRRREALASYVVLVGALLAVVLGSWFVIEFAKWNKEQACATAGGRRCGGPMIILH